MKKFLSVIAIALSLVACKKDNTVLHGKSVDNADIAQKRFCVTGNNMQVDSGSIGDFLYKPVSVFRKSCCWRTDTASREARLQSPSPVRSHSESKVVSGIRNCRLTAHH